MIAFPAVGRYARSPEAASEGLARVVPDFALLNPGYGRIALRERASNFWRLPCKF